MNTTDMQFNVDRGAASGENSHVDTPLEAIIRGIDTIEDDLWADARRSDDLSKTDVEIVRRLDHIGCFRLTSVPRHGGLGEGVGAVLRTARHIATVHPSAAWNVVVSASHVATAQCFDRDPFLELGPSAGDLQMCGSYGSPNARARRSGDHHIVDGSWAMASNAQHAHWATVDAQHEDLGPVIMIVPMSSLTVLDTWRAIGMRGTASNTLVADQLPVQNDSIIPFSRFAEIPEGPDSETLAARLPKVLRTSTGLAGVALGTTEALADAIAVRGCFSPKSFPTEGTGTSPESIFAVELGGARSRLRAARLVLESTADRLDEIGRAHLQPTPEQIVEARANLSGATRDIADALHELSFLAGSAVSVEGNDLGRLWRDARIAVSHGALTPATGFATDGMQSIASHQPPESGPQPN